MNRPAILHLPPLCVSNYPAEEPVLPSARRPNKLRCVDSKCCALQDNKGLKNWVSVQRPLCAASSTDRCNTFCELLSRRLIEQGLSRPFIELPCNGTELRLTVQGQIGATRKILAQQSVGVFV